MTAGLLLVWGVNLVVGIGLLALGYMMVRRPERLWAGLKVPGDPEAAARTRRANLTYGPMLLFLGAVDALGGPIASVVNFSALGLAGVGLGVLLVSIVVMILAAAGSR